MTDMLVSAACRWRVVRKEKFSLCQSVILTLTYSSCVTI